MKNDSKKGQEETAKVRDGMNLSDRDKHIIDTGQCEKCRR